MPDTAGAGALALFSVATRAGTCPTFVELLQKNGVTVLLDVRLNAISRKPGFSTKRLTAALNAVGIGYRHARALGNPGVGGVVGFEL